MVALRPAFPRHDSPQTELLRTNGFQRTVWTNLVAVDRRYWVVCILQACRSRPEAICGLPFFAVGVLADSTAFP